MVYPHDGLQPLSLQPSGHGFSERGPFAAGLFVQYGTSLGAERERPSVEPWREDPCGAHAAARVYRVLQDVAFYTEPGPDSPRFEDL